ncbi:hypothetical protein LSTR_LSTR001077 [Laodelphax striatellus]|uniref:Uncharacterized protein n=1 Tax=Laodelphax striatellus TaxID=195883 RepID=A0A482X1U6_LAOST|nr:hypothetical protein LSTR_LSTR001077 [Laodelphax striatellus]
MTQLVLNSTGRWLQLLGDLQLRLQAPPLSTDWSAMHNAASSEFRSLDVKKWYPCKALDDENLNGEVRNEVFLAGARDYAKFSR